MGGDDFKTIMPYISYAHYIAYGTYHS